MSLEPRTGEPFTPSQIDAIVDAASDLGFRHRVLASVVPYTGLTASELSHLRKDWRRITDPESRKCVITVPLASPCTGTLRTKPSGRRIEEREKPCWLCQDEGEWTPAGDCRHRTIPVGEPVTREVLSLCFDEYEMTSLPFTISSNFYEWMDDIAKRAGLSRRFGFKELRRSYGALLIRKGFTSEEVADYLGLAERHKARPIYEMIGEPVDWDTRQAHRVSDAELIKALNRLAAQLGRPPRMSDIDEKFEYSYVPLYDHFGGIHNALEAAGIGQLERNPPGIPQFELIEEIQRLADVLGHPPMAKEMDEDGDYSSDPYYEVFGSWDDALKEAGYDPNDTKRFEKKRIDRKCLLTELHRLAAELNKLPSKADITNKGKYSYKPYRREFGGLRNAWDAAGLCHSH